MSLRDWVQMGRKLGASDLHVEGGSALAARVGGELRPVGEAIAGNLVAQVGKDTLGADAWAQFMERGSADISIVLGGTRCRINMYRTIRGLAIAVRLLAPSVHDLRTCNLHPDLRKMIDPTSGLVVISGPTGCGKSTTLAALIEELNTTRSRHIITLESPLEYVFTNRRSFIRQREIPDAFAEFRAGHHRRLAREPGRVGHQRDAHA